MFKQFSRFLVIGGLGFLVDAGVLFVLVSLGWDAYIARLFSFAVAVTVTWWGNRNWTFQDSRPQSAHKEYSSYLLVQTSGAAVNYGVYVLVLSCFAHETAVNALIALACGSAVALLVNFFGARCLGFSNPSH